MLCSFLYLLFVYKSNEKHDWYAHEKMADIFLDDADGSMSRQKKKQSFTSSQAKNYWNTTEL